MIQEYFKNKLTEEGLELLSNNIKNKVVINVKGYFEQGLDEEAYESNAITEISLDDIQSVDSIVPVIKLIKDNLEYLLEVYGPSKYSDTNWFNRITHVVNIPGSEWDYCDSILSISVDYFDTNGTMYNIIK